jgi:hypothetical protein
VLDQAPLFSRAKNNLEPQEAAAHPFFFLRAYIFLLKTDPGLISKLFERQRPQHPRWKHTDMADVEGPGALFWAKSSPK